ncbi:MAG: hypothetical protein ACK42Y_03245 [Candidatus Thermochlorobacter sp.]
MKASAGTAHRDFIGLGSNVDAQLPHSISMPISTTILIRSITMAKMVC